MTVKINIKKGFTLVELLIVIALLGTIALIVISAINPIEQSNRARDTHYKADGSQLISAIDRYFASHSEFPWVTFGSPTTNEAAFGFVSAGSQAVGICGADCNADGLLLTGLELKTEFRNRDFIKATVDEKKLMIGKKLGASESVYTCFIPAAKSTRDKAIADTKVYTISLSDGSRTATSACNAAGTDWATNKCYVCIPE